MNSPPALPPNFVISAEARQKITDWINTISEKEQRTFIPAVFLGKMSLGPNVDAEVPVVGAYLLSNVDKNDIFDCEGLKFVYPVLEREYDLFDGKTLDIKDNKYVLI